PGTRKLRRTGIDPTLLENGMTAGSTSTVLRQEQWSGCAAKQPTLGPGGLAVRKIALVGNFLPRLCGIATFTTHLHAAVQAQPSPPAIDVYAMVESGRSYDFPPEVTLAIDQDSRASYLRAARHIEMSGADLVWV